MTPEELKEARELANFLAASPISTRITKSGKVVQVTKVTDAADTITRLCDEVERLQREYKCPTRPTCEALARSVMADQVGSS